MESMTASLEWPRSRVSRTNFWIHSKFTIGTMPIRKSTCCDTLNPLNAKGIPSLDESFVVIRLRGIKNVDFPYLLAMIDGSFMSRHNTIVVPGV